MTLQEITFGQMRKVVLNLALRDGTDTGWKSF